MADDSRSASASQDGDRDEDDEDEYEESGGENRLLGFMFGNVDNSGDLDVDYLDEDAKEHLAALADKLGSSLTDIDLSTKSPRTAADGADEDYDEKAEDAVDYEDIDEQYEGPETQALFEEDHLLPKKEYFSSEVSFRAIEYAAPIFDDENYDEEEDVEKGDEIVANNVAAETSFPSDIQGDYLGRVPEMEDDLQLHSKESEDLAVDLTKFQEEEDEVVEDPFEGKSSTPLPILCVEDGMVILRFSEIFCIHATPTRVERRERRYSIPKDRYTSMDAANIVEEDEETFLMADFKGVSSMKQAIRNQDDSTTVFKDNDSESEKLDVTLGAVRKDSCYSAEPMKKDIPFTLPLETEIDSPKLYPLDQQDWEEMIIWDDSSVTSENLAESGEISGPDYDAFVNEGMETESRLQSLQEHPVESDGTDDCFFPNSTILIEEIGSRDSSISRDVRFSERRYHPQLLRLESQLESDNSDLSDPSKENVGQELWKSDAIMRLSKLTMLNKYIIDGSWLDNIIWDASTPREKPKLILDLQDEQMLFEISDSKDGKQLGLHAGAMIITHSSKRSNGDSFDLPGHWTQSGGRFNIANDKFYSNRKISQQLKSHSKKRTAHGIKVLHSVPALKLQTNKLKLSNKDIANFHRPKALWYPHDNEVATKEQGKLSTQGPMKIILKSLGGKGIKLHVDANDTVFNVKSKASKKLDFKPTEPVRVFYSGKELQDQESLATQSVRPNSLLHIVRTKVHMLPKAQKLPGENKSLRPPGAFKKKSDLSAKDGHIFLMEYCEERPLLLGNVGMGARLCTYYQKSSAGDQTGVSLRNGNNNMGNVLVLDPADKSPFIGDIKPGCKQSSLETNMYRAPIFAHKVSSTDYLLVRSAKGKLSIRRIDTVHVVGQQEPHMEVMSPGSKGLQSYIMNRLLVFMYREFRASEQRGMDPSIRVDELSSQFPSISEAFLRKRLKHCADLQRQSNGHWFWVKRHNFRHLLEEELRRMVTPEHVCAYESMLAGQYRLKHLGITRLTLPTSISSAMNQLPDEAIALAAASHIERELQITPWNLSSNFVACTNQDRDNIERLEITGVGDPSGRGLGFSYVRTAPKAPVSSAVIKKKAIVNKAGANVTGTDADLRRLSMEAAREVLLKFNVPEEQIAKQTRWHRIAMIRKLSSEQAASGVKVDPTTINKYARGQRMSFLQLQQQTREKCQEIWDRQVQSLSAVDGDENESDSEANSDLDSFAGDLENLLDAEACEEGEEVNFESKHDKAVGVRGLNMRRNPSDAQAEEEIEDEAAEAAELFRLLLDDDEAERKKKKKMRVYEEPGSQSFVYENAERTKKISLAVKQSTTATQPDGFHATKEIIKSSREVENVNVNRNMPGMIIPLRKKGMTPWSSFNKKVKIVGDGVIKNQSIKEKKSARDKFECGACGQLGHMRTNKNCPNYGEDPEDLDKAPGRSDSLDASKLPQQKSNDSKPMPKTVAKIFLVEDVDGQKSTSKAKTLKFKCGPTNDGAAQNIDRPLTSETDTDNKSVVEVNTISISKKMKPEEVPVDSHKFSVVIRPPTNIVADQFDSHKPYVIIRPPTDTNKDQNDSHKPSIVIRPPTHTVDQYDSQKLSVVIRTPIPADIYESESHRPSTVIRPPIHTDTDQSESHRPSFVILPPSETDKDQSRKKLVIKRPKELISLESVSQGAPSSSFEYRKSNSDKRRKQENKQLSEDLMLRKNREEKIWWEEEEKRRNLEERERRYEEEMRNLEERDRVDEIKRYEETIRIDREEEERQKAQKKKKKKLPEMREEYFEDYATRPNHRRVQERDRIVRKKPTVDLGQYDAEYAQPTKRRRVGEVGLSNILENVVDILKKEDKVSFLFLKPVAKKDAPDYYKVIKNPMDLSTIREKVRKLDYKSREEFRHDVWQITFNAHKYNDGRNPGIPPLADQLLELCDYVLYQHDAALTEAESGIEQ